MSRYASVTAIPDGPDRARLEQLLDDLEHTEEEHGDDLLARLDRQWATIAQIEALVPTVTVSVADGKAVYAVEIQDNTWAVLRWIYGGGDGYVSSFGHVVAVPVEVARGMVKAAEAVRRLFPGEVTQ